MHARALLFFIGSGLLGTVAGRFFRFKGIEKVGAPVAAAITNLYPFISTGLAILLLGERVTVDDLAAFAGTIGYEVLTRLGHRYHRIYADA